MARSWFGGTSDDYLFSTVLVGTNQLLALGGSATVTFWTLQVGGTQITDLLVGGSPATSVTTSNGHLPAFQGPDMTTQMWADAGGGRVLLDAQGQQGPTGPPGPTLATWAAATAYVTGQAVTNSGVLYQSNDNHTSASTFAADASHWTAIGPVASVVGQVGAVTGAQIAADPALSATYVAALVLHPSGDTTGTTDLANMNAAITATMLFGGVVNPQPSTTPYYFNGPIIVKPGNTGSNNVPAVVPSIVGLTGAGRIGDLTSDTAAVQFIAASGFPVGSFFLDYQNSGGFPYSGTGAHISGIMFDCNYRAAGFRAQGPRKFNVHDLVIDQPATPSASYTDGCTGGFSITSPTTGADGGAYNVYTNVTVNKAQQDSFCFMTRGQDTALGCTSLAPARNNFYCSGSSDIRLESCGYEQGQVAVYAGPGSTFKVIGMDSYAGAQNWPTQNAVVLAAGRGPTGTVRYAAPQFIACDFGNAPSAGVSEESGAVVAIQNHGNGALIQGARFIGCSFTAGANTTEWIYAETILNGRVSFASCEFIGAPTTNRFNDLTGGIIRVSDPTGLSLDPLGTFVPPPTGLTVTPTGTTGSSANSYELTATNQYGETVASAIVATTISNATLSGANYNALAWTAHPANTLGIDTSFEDGGVGGWVPSASRCTITNSSAQAHSGTKSVLFTLTAVGLAPNNGVASWDLGALPIGAAYTFSAWVYVPGANTCGAALHLTPGGSGGGPFQTSGNAVPGGGWTRLVASGVTVTSAHTVINLWSTIANIASGDVVYVDDVQFEATNNVANPYQRIGYNVYGRTSGSLLKMKSLYALSYNDTGADAPSGSAPLYSTASIPPILPASGVAFQNPFCVDADVYLSGGTISAISRNSVSLPTTATSVRLRAGDKITITYSVAPTWTWTSAA